MHPDFLLTQPVLLRQNAPQIAAPPVRSGERGMVQRALVMIAYSLRCNRRPAAACAPSYSPQQGQSSGTNTVSVAEYCVRS